MLSKVKKHILILVKMIGYFIREEMQKKQKQKTNQTKNTTKQKILTELKKKKKKNCDKIQLMRLIANWR